MIERQQSLDYHASGRPGKIEMRVTKPCLTPWEIRLAYLPGAGQVDEAVPAGLDDHGAVLVSAVVV